MGANPANFVDPNGLCFGPDYVCNGLSAVEKGAQAAGDAAVTTWNAAVDTVGAAEVAVLYDVGALEAKAWTSCAAVFSGPDQCVANLIQLYAIVPTSTVSWRREAASLGAGLYQAWTSNCSVKQKVGLSIVDAANAAIGVGGGSLASKYTRIAEQAAINVPKVGAQSTLYASTTLGTSSCRKE